MNHTKIMKNCAKINVTKENEYWNISVMNKETIQLSVQTKSKDVGEQLMRSWLSCCYQSAINSNIQTKITVTKEGHYQVELINQGNSKYFEKENEVELLKELKITYLQKSLGVIPMQPLLTPNEITPVIEMSLEIFLLKGYKIKSYRQENHIENIIYNPNSFEYLMNCVIIDKKNSPYIYECLWNSSNQLLVEMNQDFSYSSRIVNPETGEMIEEQIDNNLQESLQALEFCMKTNKVKELERRETNE